MLPSGPAGFEYAVCTKLLIYSILGVSLLAGIYDLSAFLDLRVSPHITKEFQFWRLFSYVICARTSSEILLGLLLIYQFRILERLYGTFRFVSFLTLIHALSTTALSILIFSGKVRYQDVAPGPFPIVFGLLAAYGRSVPAVYKLSLSRKLELSNHAIVILLALQLAFLKWTRSLLPSAVGLSAGLLVQSVGALSRWRYPKILRRSLARYYARRPLADVGVSGGENSTSRAWPADAPYPFSSSEAGSRPNISPNNSSNDSSFIAPQASSSALGEGLRARAQRPSANTDNGIPPPSLQQIESLAVLGFSEEEIRRVWPQSFGDIERCAALLFQNDL